MVENLREKWAVKPRNKKIEEEFKYLTPSRSLNPCTFIPY
jgi:hypothetical protein